jgi:hypothetical protein
MVALERSKSTACSQTCPIDILIQLSIGYVGTLLLLLVVIAVLPAWALFDDAFAFEAEAWLHARQVGLAEAFARRAERLKHEFGSEPSWVRMVREHTPWDRPTMTRTVALNTSECAGHRARVRDGGESGAAIAGVFARFFCAVEHGGYAGVESERSFCSAVPRHPTSVVPLVVTPALTDEIGRVRHMGFLEASDQKWRFPAAGQGRLILHDPRFTLESEQPDDCRDARALQVPPPFVPPGATVGGLLGWAMVGVLVAGAILLLRFATRSVFGLGFDEPDAQASRHEPAVWRGRYLLRPTGPEKSALRDGPAYPVDLRTLTSAGSWQGLLPEDDAVDVVVWHLEHRIDEPQWNRAKLELLEHFVVRHHGHVDVTSEVDLLPYLTRRIHSPGDAASEDTFASAPELVRWARVLEPLWRQRSDLPLRPASNSSWRAVVERECRWTPRLRAISERLGDSEQLCAGLSEEDLVRFVADLADAHYRVL